MVIKGIAVAAFLFAAWLLYYLDQLPSAVEISPDTTYSASHLDELRLLGLPKGQVLEFNGAEGRGLDVRSDQVRLAPETLSTLQSSGMPLPTTKGTRLTWLGRPDAGGKISLGIANQRAGHEAGIALQFTGGGGIPQLDIRPIDTALSINLAVVSGDSGITPPITFKVGDAQVPQPLATMIPVQLELPPGETIRLRFPSAEAMKGTYFRLGVPQDSDTLASNLPIDRLEIGSAKRWTVSDGACGATAGRFLMSNLRPAAEDCGKDGDLAVEKLDVGSELKVNLSGSGFFIENQKLKAAGLWTSISNNKVIAAFLAIACMALARWVWNALFGTAKS